MRERDTKSAARTRRNKENYELLLLSRLLPLPAAITCQLDKGSIIRLTTVFLRMRKLYPLGIGNVLRHELNNNFSSGFDKELGSFFLQSLEGFVFLIGEDGKIIYVSETASVHLGLSQEVYLLPSGVKVTMRAIISPSAPNQVGKITLKRYPIMKVDLTGNNIFNHIHFDDRQELESLLKFSGKTTGNHEIKFQECENAVSFIVRLKCILAKRNAGLTYNEYKLMHCDGYIRRKFTNESTHGKNYLVAVAHSFPVSTSTEIKLNDDMVVFRFSLDMKVLAVDQGTQQILSDTDKDWMGQSFYNFIHPLDLVDMKSTHISVVRKGQAISSYLRLIVAPFKWRWVQVIFTLIHSPRLLEDSIVAICSFLTPNETKNSTSSPKCFTNEISKFPIDHNICFPEENDISYSVSNSERLSHVYPRGKRRSEAMTSLNSLSCGNDFETISKYGLLFCDDQYLTNGNNQRIGKQNDKKLSYQNTKTKAIKSINMICSIEEQDSIPNEVDIFDVFSL